MERTRGNLIDVAVPTPLALPAGDWTVLNDIARPGRRRAVIDHVVVGPPGVFVLSIENDPGQRPLGPRAPQRACAAAAAVASVWPCALPAPVRAVLCLTGAQRPTTSLGFVTVCSTETVAQTLAAMPAVLTDEQVRIVVSDLRWLLKGAVECGYRPVVNDRPERVRSSARR